MFAKLFVSTSTRVPCYPGKLSQGLICVERAQVRKNPVKEVTADEDAVYPGQIGCFERNPSEEVR